MQTIISLSIAFIIGIAFGVAYMESIYKKDIKDLTDLITHLKQNYDTKRNLN